MNFEPVDEKNTKTELQDTITMPSSGTTRAQMLGLVWDKIKDVVLSDDVSIEDRIKLVFITGTTQYILRLSVRDTTAKTCTFSTSYVADTGSVQYAQQMNWAFNYPTGTHKYISSYVNTQNTATCADASTGNANGYKVEIYY